MAQLPIREVAQPNRGPKIRQGSGWKVFTIFEEDTSSQRVEASFDKSYWDLILEGVHLGVTKGSTEFPEIVEIRIPWLTEGQVSTLVIGNDENDGGSYDFNKFCKSFCDILQYAKSRYDEFSARSDDWAVRRIAIGSIIRNIDGPASFGLSRLSMFELEMLCHHDRILASISMICHEHLDAENGKKLLDAVLEKVDYGNDPWVLDYFYKDGKPKYEGGKMAMTSHGY